MFILHIANLYLDKPFFSCSNPQYGKKRRQKQREVLDTIINKVSEYGADVLLIAGNLIDAEYITDSTLQFLYEKLESIKSVPVIVIPGVSDPITESSPYILEDWPENVVILEPIQRKKWESNRLPLVVHTLTDDDIKVGNFDTLGIPDTYDGRNHILLIYDVPIANSKTDLSQWFQQLPSVISYVALGKGHEFKQIYSDSKLTACSCGLPDPLSIDNTPPFGLLGIQFQQYDNRWEVSQVEHISTQRNFYTVLNIDVSNITNSGELQEQLRSEFNRIKKPCVVHVHLIGVMYPRILHPIYEVMELFQGENLFLTWSIDAQIDGFETPEDMRQITILSEYFKQITEEQRYAPNPVASQIAKRASHLTVRVVDGISLKIPAVETYEVPLKWNL